MKSYDEMYDLILKTAMEDKRIRAVTMEGSNVTKGAVHDEFSDFDITFFVSDIREFTRDHDYMKRFGDILIMQMPDDYYAEPYDYNGRSRFAYLTQYKDGNRIDLTFIDVSEIGKQVEFTEPRTVLVNKDDYKELVDITSKECFYIKKPTEFEFFGTVNEFRWISNYVTKGLCRHEFYYARRMMEEYMMNMFLKMINWKIGIDNGFQVTTGACCKYLKNYLAEEEMTRFEGMFPKGDYEDMWEKLFLMYDFFEELSVYVAEKLGFSLDFEESKNVREFMVQRRASK
ncbi:aminoglycoside 6-adenylyltransferase [Butyrivibrio sp. Su6]|uniref:aminoglycoside 6-adenylyltransferase n=1 Tax=Butyrivibrio sp. Su6 TaxID=1520810 RepID=UPI00089F20CD|nr:aminoglycoside 6-adenylyltransferase [Butyrivibrio sp. Su6]SEF90705.1 aminoglycoside 6-adenylyltransferase [Butyrivibrio sp. Su6]